MYAFTVTAHGSRSRLTVTVTRGVEGFVFNFPSPPAPPLFLFFLAWVMAQSLYFWMVSGSIAFFFFPFSEWSF